MKEIPYNSGVQMVASLLGGHVDLYVSSIAPIVAHVRSGRVKCPMVTSVERVAALPAASSLKDLGIPEAATVIWRGILGPKGIPADRIAVLERAFETAAKTPGVRKYLEDSGEELVIRKGTEFRKMVADEFEAFGRIAESLNLPKQ